MSIKKLPFFEVLNNIGFGFMCIAFINYDIRIKVFLAYPTDKNIRPDFVEQFIQFKTWVNCIN